MHTQQLSADKGADEGYATSSTPVQQGGIDNRQPRFGHVSSTDMRSENLKSCTDDISYTLVIGGASITGEILSYNVRVMEEVPLMIMPVRFKKNSQLMILNQILASNTEKSQKDVKIWPENAKKAAGGG